MLFPRFTIRTVLAIVTGCAVLFLIVGTAYRGQTWAWGATIGAASLLLTALVHGAWFGIVWLFSQMLSGENSVLVEPSEARPAAPVGFGAAQIAGEEARRRHASAGEASL